MESRTVPSTFIEDPTLGSLHLDSTLYHTLTQFRTLAAGCAMRIIVAFPRVGRVRATGMSRPCTPLFYGPLIGAMRDDSFAERSAEELLLIMHLVSIADR